nr:MAG TPA: hypothetical protein [Caudoviricetes sp.]
MHQTSNALKTASTASHESDSLSNGESFLNNH